MQVVLPRRETVAVSLRAIEGAELQCYTSMTARDVEKINANKDGGNILLPLSLVISSWNLTNEKGEVLPITVENVGLLDIRDVNHIMKTINISLESFLDETQTMAG